MSGTPLDAKLVPKAHALLKKFGKSVDFSKADTPVYDPVTMATTNSGTLTQTAKISPPEKYSDFYIDGTTIKAGDAHCYVSPVGLDWIPKQGNSVEIDGAKFEIIRCSPIYTGEKVALYELQLRA